MNIFIEGLQGMGKTTLLQTIWKKHPGYQVYREGDYCPLELAWCTYMTQEEYETAIGKYPSLTEEIERWTTREGDRYVVSYTRIITDEPGFHKFMEQFEIYGGRKPSDEFARIILERYKNFFTGDGENLFECAFLQNIIEELILFQQMSDEEILTFYKNLFAVIPKDKFRLYYLHGENIEKSIMQIRKERSDGFGNELWYQLMLAYLKESPYGKQHHISDFKDMIDHFKHRQNLELRIVREIAEDFGVILPAKEYGDENFIPEV